MTTLALIGSGRWAMQYMYTARSLRNCNVKYICSPHVERKDFSRKLIKVNNYKDLIQVKDIDGIIIASSAASHYEIAKFFLEKKYNLLIEKPLTTTFKKAQSLKSISAKNSSAVMVGHIYLFHPAITKLKSLLSQIGKVRYVYSEGVDYGEFRKDISGLWDWASHDVSMSISVLGKMPKKVAAWATSLDQNKATYDIVFMRLHFKKGRDAYIRVGRLSPVKKRTFTVVGSQGSIVFDESNDCSLTFYLKNQIKEKFSFELIDSTPLRNQLEAFISSIINKKSSDISNLSDGVDVIKIISAAEKSIKQKREIYL